MDRIFHDALYDHFLCYIDDGLTYSESFALHLSHLLDSILSKCAEAGISLSLSKCKLGYTEEVKLLVGYIIVNRQGLEMTRVRSKES